VTVATSLFPSTAAVIFAVPGATATTNPELETLAVAGSEVLQEKLRCNGLPDAVVAVAESWSVAAGTSVAVSEEIVTDATVGGGGPTMLSPQDPISAPTVIDAMER